MQAVRCAGVPTFQITIHNEDFTSSDAYDAESQEAALKHAIRSAISIASDEVSSGKPFFGAEVTLEKGEEELIRYVIAVGGSPLKAE